MTVSYSASYRTPDDPAEFDENYVGSHVPPVERTPGLLENRVHHVTRPFVGEPAHHLPAQLVFGSPEAMEQAFTSEEWAASGRDLQSWGGIERVTMSSAEPHESAGPAGTD